MMNMAMSWQTAQTGYHHQVHLQGTEIPILTQDTMIDLHLTIIIRTDIGLTDQDPIPTVIDTEVTARVMHGEVTPGHITDAYTEAYCTTDIQAHITITEILHIEDLHHTEVFWHIPEITVDLDHVPHTKLPTQQLLSLPTSPTGQPGKNKNKKYKQVTIDDPPSNYYSSDEPSSESDEDLN